VVNGQAGKGSTYRKVDKKKYDKNYDMIFKNKKKELKDGNNKTTRP
jgi:hypothetical protein